MVQGACEGDLGDEGDLEGGVEDVGGHLSVVAGINRISIEKKKDEKIDMKAFLASTDNQTDNQR